MWKKVSLLPVVKGELTPRGATAEKNHLVLHTVHTAHSAQCILCTRCCDTVAVTGQQGIKVVGSRCDRGGNLNSKSFGTIVRSSV